MSDEVTTSLVQAQTNGPIPDGVTVLRCVLCNCQIATRHEGDWCSCEVEVCPNSECPGHDPDYSPEET